MVEVVIGTFSAAVKPPGQDELRVTMLSHGPPVERRKSTYTFLLSSFFYLFKCDFFLLVVIPETKQMKRRMANADTGNIFNELAGFFTSGLLHLYSDSGFR